MLPRNWGLLSFLYIWSIGFVTPGVAFGNTPSTNSIEEELRFVQVAAATREDRSAIADLGVSIEAVRSDSVWGFARGRTIEKLEKSGIQIIGNFDFTVGRGGHENIFDFPGADARFHNYEEMRTALTTLASRFNSIAKLEVIGKTIQDRDIFAVHINTSQEALETGVSNKPGIVFMGNHHAREHVSAEIPLMLAQYLLQNQGDAQIGALLDSRDIWIIPMVNPDGVEWDIATTSYRWWRKNRRDNKDGTFGVDLNRNYGFKWGTGGSDTDTSSDVYMGTAPFSEPETQAIKAFVESKQNTKVLLSFHTFSELILYPWGHSYDPVTNQKDRETFEKMARTMAQWNRYKPQQSSDLYIASGDTTDWAYGERGIFAFTFELSPKSVYNGGFYPGAGVIDKVFNANLKPCLYLIDVADNPYKVLGGRDSGWLKNYVEPSIPHSAMWEMHPLM